MKQDLGERLSFRAFSDVRMVLGERRKRERVVWVNLNG